MPDVWQCTPEQLRQNVDSRVALSGKREEIAGYEQRNEEIGGRVLHLRVVEQRGIAVSLEFDEQVDVALGREFVACRGAEQADPRDAEATARGLELRLRYAKLLPDLW